MYFKIFINPNKFGLNAAIFAAFNLIFTTVFCQEINEFFRLKNSDNLFITNGFTEVNGKSYGIGISVDSVNQSFFNIFNFGSEKKIEIDYSVALGNSYNYIQFTPPKIDKLNRLYHAFSMENSNIGRNGKFIIFNSKSGLLIDSVYLSPHKTGFSSAVQKPDSTFLLFGTSTEFDPIGDFYVVHVGKNGEFISDTTYGNTNLAERGYAITTTSDGGYAFTGSRRVTVSGQPYRSKIVVYKFDSLGALEWTNQYGGDYYNIPYSINSLNDSLILIGGLNALKETTPDYFLERPYSVILNLNGLIKYDYFFQLKDSFSDGFITNQAVYENQIYSVGYWYFFPFSDSIISDEFLAHPSFIVKHNQQLVEIWRRYIYKFENQESDNSLYSIEKTTDGGFILGGTINGKAPDPVGQYGWIVKTDSLGCVVPGCHLVGVENNNGHIANNFLVYPNPSNNAQNTWLSFNLAKTEAVSIEILNLNGQIVKAQNFGLLPQGNHQIQIDVTLASGIYFINLQTPSFSETVKWVVE